MSMEKLSDIMTRLGFSVPEDKKSPLEESQESQRIEQLDVFNIIDGSSE